MLDMTKQDRKTMPATVFAERMGVDYSTVVRWLKRKIVPGAVLRESPDRGKWWEIPEAALSFERPKAGRKPLTTRTGDDDVAPAASVTAAEMKAGAVVQVKKSKTKKAKKES